jgi:hypothetical protein
MANTTNFNWETPDDTDLVKDGAAAMRTLGNSIDTSFVDLKGGTTGQILSKASNTDLDYTWVTTDDANAIQNAIVDAKGDLIAATAADTPARLAVGTNGQVLTADSTAATGLKYATPYAGTWTKVANGSIGAVGSITFSSLSGNNFYVYMQGWSSTSTATLQVQINGDNASNYLNSGGDVSSVTNKITVSASIAAASQGYNGIFFPASLGTQGHMVISGANGGLQNDAGGAVISSITFLPSAGTFDSGTYEVWSN